MDHVEKPCATCGTPVLVHPYAATKFVKCADHKGLTVAKKMQGRKSMLDPFAPGLDEEERQRRATGAVVTLKRKEGEVEWDEEMTLTRIRSFDEETGEVQVSAQGGALFQPPLDPRREMGQFHAFRMSEVAGVR